MTTTQNPGYDEADVLQFAGADEDRDKTNDIVPFRLAGDDTVYVGQRPKMAVLLEVLSVLNDDTDEMAQAMAFGNLLEDVLQADSVTALRKRLTDRTDELDLDSPGIEQMFKTLVGLWYGGPTGKAPASRPSRARTGRGSTVRARSKGSTR
jgi:DNA-binding protein